MEALTLFLVASGITLWLLLLAHATGKAYGHLKNKYEDWISADDAVSAFTVGYKTASVVERNSGQRTCNDYAQNYWNLKKRKYFIQGWALFLEYKDGK